MGAASRRHPGARSHHLRPPRSQRGAGRLLRPRPARRTGAARGEHRPGPGVHRRRAHHLRPVGRLASPRPPRLGGDAGALRRARPGLDPLPAPARGAPGRPVAARGVPPGTGPVRALRVDGERQRRQPAVRRRASQPLHSPGSGLPGARAGRADHRRGARLGARRGRAGLAGAARCCRHRGRRGPARSRPARRAARRLPRGALGGGPLVAGRDGARRHARGEHPAAGRGDAPVLRLRSPRLPRQHRLAAAQRRGRAREGLLLAAQPGHPLPCPARAPRARARRGQDRAPVRAERPAGLARLAERRGRVADQRALPARAAAREAQRDPVDPGGGAAPGLGAQGRAPLGAQHPQAAVADPGRRRARRDSRSRAPALRGEHSHHGPGRLAGPRRA